jgi:hypothetical protein
MKKKIFKLKKGKKPFNYVGKYGKACPGKWR